MAVSRFSDLAVDVVVANPAGRDARRVPALELAGPAGGGSAFHLVGAVAAVVLAVAHEVPGNAPAAGARELVGGAGDITWRQNKGRGRGLHSKSDTSFLLLSCTVTALLKYTLCAKRPVK